MDEFWENFPYDFADHTKTYKDNIQISPIWIYCIATTSILPCSFQYLILRHHPLPSFQAFDTRISRNMHSVLRIPSYSKHKVLLIRFQIFWIKQHFWYQILRNIWTKCRNKVYITLMNWIHKYGFIFAIAISVMNNDVCRLVYKISR